MGLAFGLLIVFEVFGSKIELADHDQLVQGFHVIPYREGFVFGLWFGVVEAVTPASGLLRLWGDVRCECF
jgi:hypothetical protein